MRFFRCITPLRSALTTICQNPASDRATEAARQLAINSIKCTNIRCQIDNLLHLKKNGIYPKSLYTQKQPISNNPFVHSAWKKDRKEFNWRNQNYNQQESNIERARRDYSNSSLTQEVMTSTIINNTVMIPR